VLCVQNETYAERLEALGAAPDRLVVTGNLKFDSCPTAAPAGRDEALACEFGLGPAERVLVGGCTWPGEDEALLSAYRTLRAQFPRLRLILAPRQAERFGPVEHLVRQAGLPCVRRTALGEGAQGEPDAVILLDTVGELARVYGLATVVFVGGSLIPHGGHNILEPSGLAKPVLFGPHTANFRDITDEFIAHSAARRVADPQELTKALRELLLNPQAAADLGSRARKLVDHHQGATSRTLAALEPLFP
jgi:3-deoxy-D-manno-octulosonic-acid transferase